MLAGAFAGGGRRRRSSGSAWLGLGMAILISVALRAGARLRLDHPSRQPDRLRRRHQLHRRRLDHHPRPGLVQPGRPHAAAAARDARFAAITCPAPTRCGTCRSSGRSIPNCLSGHSLLVYLAFLMVPFTWWVLFRTRFGLRLRAVGENPAAVDTAGISVTWLRYRARDLHRHPHRHRRRLSVDGAECRLREGHDRRQGLYRARRADLRQVEAGAGHVRLPAVRLPRRRCRSACRARRCRSSARCRCSSCRRCPIS